ncbi:MAG: kinase to dihydroxyacetone kinase [Oscillospiraceae bacterium]|nr:kinase to dihydroxyacetone kinase [Oscillospiraceae bacterium]
MLAYKFDVQLLIAGENLSEDAVFAYISAHIEGDSLLAVGDESLIKIHFHTNAPWEVLAYGASLGDIHDIVVENMERQANGLEG